MTRRSAFILAWIVLVGTSSAVAQTTDPTRPRLYRLDDGSTFERGCFPPCMCPVMEQAPVRGTFRLTPAGSDGLFEYFDVADVNWKVRLAGGDLPITGSGAYRIGGELALQHELSLDLAVDRDLQEHFDSGLVVQFSRFPRIDIRISIHGGYCFDTVIEVRSKPVTRLQVDRGTLSWDTDVETATGYDIVRGSLSILRGTGGAFDVATEECVGDDWPTSSVSYVVDPNAGDAFWFLVRAAGDTYDSGDVRQVGSRDSGINASPASCP